MKKILNEQLKSPQFQNMPAEAKAENSYIMLMTKDRITNELIVKTILEQQIKNIKSLFLMKKSRQKKRNS